MKVGLCLLTLNEAAGCRHDVPLLDLSAFDEVYAVDGGSTDDTVAYLESMGIRCFAQERPGYNAAYVSAFRRCTSDALVFFHPKGSIDLADLLKVRPLLEAGYDLVVASRICRGAVNEEDDRLIRPRKWFVMGLAAVAWLVWRREGNMIWDVLHGFRAMRRDAFFAMQPLETGLSMDLEMVVRSYQMRTRRTEFPVREAPRLSGATHFPALGTGKKLPRYLWSELRRPAPPANGHPEGAPAPASQERSAPVQRDGRPSDG